MGSLFSNLLAAMSRVKESRILILGLDNAGKTTVLYKWRSPKRVIRTMPTIGFNVETFQHENVEFTMWDLGGQSNIRPYWRNYCAHTAAVVYVVDSADRERLELSARELLTLLQEDELQKCALLVFANKQDQPNCLSELEISNALALHTLKNRQWHVQKSVATNGTGLNEGLSWLTSAVA